MLSGLRTDSADFVAGQILLSISVFVAALRSRYGPYILCGFFFCLLLLLFSSPNLGGRRVDIYHTFTHGVALVRI